MRGREKTSILVPLVITLVLCAFSVGKATAVDQAEAAVTQAPSALDRFSPEQREQLLKGKAVYEYIVDSENKGSTSGQCKASILIKVPVDDCFNKFAEIEKHKLYFPRKTVSDVVEVRDNKTLAYKELDFSLKTIKYHILYTINPEAHRIDFELDKSHPSDLKESEGFFQFFAIDGNTTLFDYGITNAEANVKVPGFLRRYMTSKDLPKVVTNYKKWVESGGTWKK